MKAGRELDALIAEKVMEFDKLQVRGETLWRYSPGEIVSAWVRFEPSTDISDAWLVVEKLMDNGCYYAMKGFGSKHRIFFQKYYPDDKCQLEIDVKCDAETAPLAICLAAIKACGVEVEDV